MAEIEFRKVTKAFDKVKVRSSTKSFVCATKHRRFFFNQKEKGQAVSNR